VSDTFLSDYVVDAANHDASHRHDEAVNSLARGVKSGDVESMTRLGKRLLVGDSAPYRPREGVRFLIDAAKAGGAEAPAILAVVSAAGAHVRQSWNEGLSALVLAAERGWRPAQEQLCVLAVDRDLAAAASELSRTSGDVWKRLGQSVSAGPWHVAPERRELSADPAIVSFPGLLSPTLCDWLIEQATPRLEPARINETHTNSAARFSLIDVTFAHLLIQARMAVSCGLPIQHMEASTVLHYRPGQEFPPHHDYVDQRVLTFLACLNDDYEGGETDFSELGIRHKGTRGEGLYFSNAFPDGRPDMRTKHAGLPTTQGDKWVLSQFVRSNAFR
jgi:prolyl 4-hydroxylase